MDKIFDWIMMLGPNFWRSLDRQKKIQLLILLVLSWILVGGVSIKLSYFIENFMALFDKPSSQVSMPLEPAALDEAIPLTDPEKKIVRESREPFLKVGQIEESPLELEKAPSRESSENKGMNNQVVLPENPPAKQDAPQAYDEPQSYTVRRGGADGCLRKTQNPYGECVAALQAGEIVYKMTESQRGWMFVRTRDNNQGYVRSADVVR